MKIRLLSSATGLALVGSVLIAPSAAAMPDCDIQDVACWKDYYGVETPDYGYNKPTPTPTPTATPSPEEKTEDNETITEDNELVTDNETVTKDNEIVTDVVIDTIEEAEEVLEDDLFGQEVVIELSNGDRLSGEVTAEEKFALQDSGAIVEPDAQVSINYSWGQDRINQPSLPLDNYYDNTGIGAGVEVYIVDTGVNWMHPNFNNISPTGFDYIGGDGWRDGSWQDRKSVV